jgi:hypothetical protein
MESAKTVSKRKSLRSKFTQNIVDTWCDYHGYANGVAIYKLQGRSGEYQICINCLNENYRI